MLALSIAREFVARLAPAASSAARMTRGIVTAVENRREVRRLGEADERLLKDIGLTQGDISAALDTPFYVDPSANLALHSGGRTAAFTSGAAQLRRADVALMIAR